MVRSYTPTFMLAQAIFLSYSVTMPERKNQAAVALAKKRARSLTPKQRKEIARKAAKARWSKKSGN